MTEIYLIRHVQTEGNLYRVMQGHYDGAVTPLGYRQAELLGERFRSVPIDALYSSDLHRTRVTASAIERTHKLELHTDARLREINVGPWERRFFGDLLYEEPALIETFIRSPDAWRLEGAETMADVTDEIARRHDGQRVAVVSHGVTIRCLLTRILSLTPEQAAALPVSGNTAVTHLFYENGRWRADYIGDASHLEALHLPAWERSPDVRAEAIDPLKQSEYYSACYADAWRAAHGSLAGYEPEPYLAGAAEHRAADPRSVLRLWCGDEAMGLLDLDTRRGAGLGVGWISLLYIAPAYRHRGCGIQLLGRAVMHYRDLGRTALRLHAAESNREALAFYERSGFTCLSAERTDLGRLLLLEKKLGGPTHV